jgi:ribosomal protein L28
MMNGNDVLDLLKYWGVEFAHSRQRASRLYKLSLGDKRFLVAHERASVSANVTASVIHEFLDVWNLASGAWCE